MYDHLIEITQLVWDHYSRGHFVATSICLVEHVVYHAVLKERDIKCKVFRQNTEKF